MYLNINSISNDILKQHQVSIDVKFLKYLCKVKFLTVINNKINILSINDSILQNLTSYIKWYEEYRLFI